MTKAEQLRIEQFERAEVNEKLAAQSNIIITTFTELASEDPQQRNAGATEYNRPG